MATIKIIRIPLLALLFILLMVILTASDLSGYAVTALGIRSEDTTNGTFMAYLPVTDSVIERTNCRYGGSYPADQPLSNPWLKIIGSGHYINFSAAPNGPPVTESIEHIPMVRTRQDIQNGQYLPTYTINPHIDMSPSGLGPKVLANPGRLWLVGNEPDVSHPSQDNTYPEVYAQAYHDVYHFIKDLDPNAQVAVAGLSMMTPGRLQYLDIVWNTYLQKYGEEMQVDVWNLHLYILSEIRPWDGGPSDGKVALGTDPALAKKAPWGDPLVECPKDDVYCRAEHDDLNIFKDQLIALRTWMKEHGQQNKPLILTEFSQLYPFVDYDDPVNPTQCFLMDEFKQCFTQSRVISHMHKTIDYMESAKDPNLGYPADDYRLVQHWTWFSLWTEPESSGGSSSLLKDDYANMSPGSLNAMTQIGQAYRNRIMNSELTYNLVAGEARDVQAKATGGTADVQLTAGFFNNGSGSIGDSFKVTFYADENLTQVIGETEVVPRATGVINGCSWGRIADWTSITWTGVPVGTHDYWVKVDSHNGINVETDEMDNVAKGNVTVEL
jgi:hypothetical protein